MSQRLKGTAAWLGLLVIVCGTIWAIMAPDLSEARETEETYVRKLALLARLQALPKEESAIRKQLEQLSEAAAERMLYSGNPNEVQLRMQQTLRQLASQDRLPVQSMRAMARFTPMGMLQKTTVQLNFAATHEQLVAFLKRLEAAEPILRVGVLSVRVQRPSTDTTPAELSVRMEVAGFWKSNEKGTAR